LVDLFECDLRFLVQ